VPTYFCTLRSCSATVFANAWLREPFEVATKKKKSLPSGDSVASIEALPGFEIGPGGRPSIP